MKSKSVFAGFVLMMIVAAPLIFSQETGDADPFGPILATQSEQWQTEFRAAYQVALGGESAPSLALQLAVREIARVGTPADAAEAAMLTVRSMQRTAVALRQGQSAPDAALQLRAELTARLQERTGGGEMLATQTRTQTRTMSQTMARNQERDQQGEGEKIRAMVQTREQSGGGK